MPKDARLNSTHFFHYENPKQKRTSTVALNNYTTLPSNNNQITTLIWVGFLQIRFEMCVEVVKVPLLLKRVRITLEIWLVSTQKYVVLENIPFSTKALLILLMSAFF